MKIVIVGGVAGGASAAARLRRLDEKAEIIILERGGYISFANCGLPYYIGGEIQRKENLLLQTPQSFNARFNIDVRINNEVLAVNRAEKTVSVMNHATGQTYTESYDRLILSMGAKPFVPDIGGKGSRRIFTLRNVPDTLMIKEFIANEGAKTALVMGGGYIGVEIAENLVSAGLKVTLAELSDQVIAPIDFDMACDVHNYMRHSGIDLRLKTKVSHVEDKGEYLEAEVGGDKIKVDMLIVAVGVSPESDIAQKAGLAVTSRGCIITNNQMLTNDESIYAVGDAVETTNFVTDEKGYIPLAGPANKQGRIAADNICGIKSEYKNTQGSAILKLFDMTVASTGINEKTAKALGLDYEKSFTYSASHATYYPGATQLGIKLIFSKADGRVLGAQVIGFEGVDKRCDVLATAIRAKMTVSDLTELELCYAPPFSSAKDPVNMAGYVAENIQNGLTKIFHWHDLNELMKNPNNVFLDVRTEYEHRIMKMDGFVNIPVDDLRKNLDKLDKSKTYYITCQVGLRGYIASRILSQNGFDCYNLSGGARLVLSVLPNLC